MPPTGAERWFHTLVVVGAALAGCGGKTLEQGGPATRTRGGAMNGGATSASAGRPGQSTGGSGTASPEACSFHTEFVCDDYATLSNCSCDPSAPHDASACQSPFDFVCTEIPCTPSANVICLGVSVVGCRCDPSAPRPEDCEMPEQFFCTTLYPDWRDCACRPEAAVDPASCPDSYCCQSHDPRFGCDCSCARIK